MRKVGLVKENQTLGISAKEFRRDSLAQDLYRNDLLRLAGRELISSKATIEKSVSQRVIGFQVVRSRHFFF